MIDEEKFLEAEPVALAPEVYEFVRAAIPDIPNDGNVIVGQLIGELSDMVLTLGRLENEVKRALAEALARGGYLDAAAFVRRTIQAVQNA